MTLRKDRIYQAYGRPHRCVSVNRCRAVLVPVDQPWESKKVSVSAESEVKEVRWPTP